MAQPLTACQRNPELWFDRAHRRPALEKCLACPRRSWCARQALSIHPAFGMWAGIWVDHNLDEVAHYLRAIAEDAPVDTASPEPPNNPQPPRSASVAATFEPARGSAGDGTTADGSPRSVSSLILARASGHCEIMTGDCSYRLDFICSRKTGRAQNNLPNPAWGYGTCRYCDFVLQNTDHQILYRLGYLVAPPTPFENAAFYWRQTQHVHLDLHGRVVDFEVDPLKRTA